MANSNASSLKKDSQTEASTFCSIGGTANNELVPFATGLTRFNKHDLTQAIKGRIISYNPDSHGVASFYIIEARSCSAVSDKDLTMVRWLSLTTSANKDLIPPEINVRLHWEIAAAAWRDFPFIGSDIFNHTSKQLQRAAE